MHGTITNKGHPSQVDEVKDIWTVPKSYTANQSQYFQFLLLLKTILIDPKLFNQDLNNLFIENQLYIIIVRIDVMNKDS